MEAPWEPPRRNPSQRHKRCMPPSTIRARSVWSSLGIALQGIFLIVSDPGSRTIEDPSVRRTWQLSPQFELRNPEWPSVVQRAIEQVAQELGCTEAASLSAQLYKLPLYEEGAMFKPRQDYVVSNYNAPNILLDS